MLGNECVWCMCGCGYEEGERMRECERSDGKVITRCCWFHKTHLKNFNEYWLSTESRGKHKEREKDGERETDGERGRKTNGATKQYRLINRSISSFSTIGPATCYHVDSLKLLSVPLGSFSIHIKFVKN